MRNVAVIKLNPAGDEVWRYTGQVLAETPHSILLEAYFNRDDMPFHGIVLKKNDLFVEAYYNDRWYNIFEIYDRSDRQLKAWYCNVCCPSEFTDSQVSYVDLALDLLVIPGIGQIVLDEDEFEALDLPAPLIEGARQGLRDLQKLFTDNPAFRLKP